MQNAIVQKTHIVSGDPLVRRAKDVAGASNPSASLRRLRALRAALDEFEEEQVAIALAEGASLASVGRDLGLSRQSIHRRYRHLSPTADAGVAIVFSPEVRLAVRYARDEAAELGDPVDGQHLLIGLMYAGPPFVLEEHGVTLEKLRVQVSGASRRTRAFGGEPQYELRELLTQPARDALQRGSRRIDGEDLLTGLLRDADSPASRTLRAVGADPVKIRGEVLAAITGE